MKLKLILNVANLFFNTSCIYSKKLKKNSGYESLNLSEVNQIFMRLFKNANFLISDCLQRNKRQISQKVISLKFIPLNFLKY